jgi:hypothetical protein
VKIGEMKNSRFIRSNHAVAGVIEALLLIGLVAIILSTIQVVYVPVIMEQKESEHMDTVENQLAHLKSVIETQAIMGVAGGDLPVVYSPMSSPITLGGNALPYLVSQGSRGTINIIDKDNTKRGKITMAEQDLPDDYPLGIPLTSVVYDATNYYFVDQNYILEGGAIILEQPGTANKTEGTTNYTMKVDVPMKVENHSAYIKIFYTIPVFDAPANKFTIENEKDNYFVRTNYVSYSSSVETQPDNLDDDYLYIYTDYPKAWFESLVRDDSGVLWEYNNSGMIHVSLNDPVNPTYVKIESGSAKIDVELTIVEIDIQVGAGYVIPNKD